MLWMFGDSWIGPVVDGAHRGARMVRNAIAIQRGEQFQFGEGEYFAPPDGKGWIWPCSGFVVAGRLHVLLACMERAGRNDIWDFRCVRTVLATVDDPRGDPARWTFRYLELPGGPWGCAALVADGRVHVFGTHDDAQRKDRSWRVASAPEDRVEDPSAWTFGTEDLFWQAGSEGSVSRYGDQFVAVYTEGGMSDRILLRMAPLPTGPWSEPRVVFRCPEAAWDPQNFCYAAKGHPELSREGTLLVSYCVNCFDFWKMAKNANIYRPRFVEVPLQP